MQLENKENTLPPLLETQGLLKKLRNHRRTMEIKTENSDCEFQRKSFVICKKEILMRTLEPKNNYIVRRPRNISVPRQKSVNNDTLSELYTQFLSQKVPSQKKKILQKSFNLQGKELIVLEEHHKSRNILQYAQQQKVTFLRRYLHTQKNVNSPNYMIIQNVIKLHYELYQETFLKRHKVYFDLRERNHVLEECKSFSYQQESSNLNKYSVELILQNKICWKVKNSGELEAFGLHTRNNEIKWFFSDNSELIKLKRLLANKVLYQDVKDFFVAQSFIWKGKNFNIYVVNLKYDKNTQFISKCFEKKKIEFHILEQLLNILKILNHKNIDKLYEIYEGKSTYCLIFEQIQGISVSQLIAESIKPINLTLIREIMKEALIALQYIHSLGIIHRDIKPSNMLVQISNKFNIQFKLIDFTLASHIKDLRFEMMRCGTPGYLAPEIINKIDVNKKYTAQCDVFSLGAVFYKLLTRKSLFRGANEQEIYMANLKCRLNFQGLHFLHLPSAAIHLLSQMLEIDPKERISASDALQHPYFKEQQEYESSQNLTKSKNLSILARSEQSLEYDLLKVDYFQNELPPSNPIPIIPKVKGGCRQFELDDVSLKRKIRSQKPSYSCDN